MKRDKYGHDLLVPRLQGRSKPANATANHTLNFYFWLEIADVPKLQNLT